jgi:hypothetical protein
MGTLAAIFVPAGLCLLSLLSDANALGAKRRSGEKSPFKKVKKRTKKNKDKHQQGKESTPLFWPKFKFSNLEERVRAVEEEDAMDALLEKLEFGPWLGSLSEPSPGESMSIAKEPVYSPDLPFNERLLSQYGYGWLLSEEGGHVPGKTDVEGDLRFVIIGAVLLTVARVVFQRVFKAAWMKFGVGNNFHEHANETAKKRESRADKASESAWKSLFYTPFWLMCVFAVWSADWWVDTRLVRSIS